MKKVLIVVALVIALILSAPWWLPARWVSPRLEFATHGELSLTEVQGTLVEGRARLLVTRAGIDAPVRWTAVPLSRQVTIKLDEQGSAKLTYLGNAVDIVSDGVLALPLRVALPIPGAAKLAATANLRDLKGQWANGQWRGSATVSASDARLENRLFPLPLGPINARLNDNGSFEGTLDGAWLAGRAQGNINLSDKGAHGDARGSLTPKRSLPPVLAGLLPQGVDGQSNVPFAVKF